jgi:hypothetical protein
MSITTFELSAGAPNTLRVPRAIRDYINERGEGRSFNLESFTVSQNTQPRQIAVDFRITPTGAEQLEPFTVSLILGEPATKQLFDALNLALVNDAQRE